MATNYSANQYQSAFRSTNLQSWSVPKQFKEQPSTHEGQTQFIANDRGHLLPGVPKSKASPWGTFMGTWDMPLKIPPAKVTMTSRSAQASKRLTDWIHNASPLITSCNGLRPQITGKASEDIDGEQKHSSRTIQENRASPLETVNKTITPGPPPQSQEGSGKASPVSSKGRMDEERAGSGQRRPPSYVSHSKNPMRDI
ncbi:protein Flattop isoform X2 [Spea bombifrons]|uniref:protein Flattop isoform X2 n=1 Tax=Spea bombifrons TaxID=233779 RepID=UPI0023497C54|nr:protein Flattop isoform X2 [Spea bombifrons]